MSDPRIEALVAARDLMQFGKDEAARLVETTGNLRWELFTREQFEEWQEACVRVMGLFVQSADEFTGAIDRTIEDLTRMN